MKEFTTAVNEVMDEAEDVTEDPYIEFKLDGRVMRAFEPTEGQLIYMAAAMGRGQSNNDRFGAIINLMLGTLREEDRDYVESRLLSRDPQTRISVQQLEGIFEHLTSEWFARPTQSPSDSA